VYKYLLLLFLVGCSVSQKTTDKFKDDAALTANIQKHVQYLADDKLEGRRTGSEGEKLAADYIIQEFKNAGLEPKGTNSYLQPFQVNEGREYLPASSLSIDDQQLELGKDFYPLPYSANASVQGLPSIALQENGLPWFYDLKDLLKENASNPHFDPDATILSKAQSAQKKGATAFIIYNTSSAPSGIKFNPKDRTPVLSIPVVYVSQEASRKLLPDPSAMVDIKVKTELTERVRTGNNVIGFINNNAPTTVVIGAHYDHLGYGEDKTSLYAGKEALIHNGADDNASGTAALIELSKLLKTSNLKSNNYLFIAFSGEEQGLFGSKYFTENATVPLTSVNYMINMDMVGRLNDSSKVVTVGGYGTTPMWGSLYSSTSTNKLYVDGLQFRFDSSGTGPSDHTSFYRKDIPVLFYFTGLHSDYHKPTDDFDKLNYRGETQVIKHIYSVIENIDHTKTKLAFSKTRETQTSTAARFSVSMGIMPDYTFTGAGVRVDGVSENKPAEKAGIKAGDIITAIDNNSISSLESYMQALGRYKKGDKAKVSFKRGSQTLSASVEF
jgi:Zn-dependent M28 family amino/carboxypeptidase